MKKIISVFITMIFLIATFSFGASAAYSYSGYSANVDSTVDSSSSTDSSIGTDFYIIDYQNQILTYQLVVSVPMYVSLAVYGNGIVAVPNSTAYGFTNYSASAVNITDVTVTDDSGGWALASTLTTKKQISVSLAGTNFLTLDTANSTALATALTQIPKATTLTGTYQSYAITASAYPDAVAGDAAIATGRAFNVSYTLALANNYG